eukprot:s1246_g3.t1
MQLWLLAAQLQLRRPRSPCCLSACKTFGLWCHPSPWDPASAVWLFGDWPRSNSKTFMDPGQTELLASSRAASEMELDMQNDIDDFLRDAEDSSKAPGDVFAVDSASDGKSLESDDESGGEAVRGLFDDCPSPTATGSVSTPGTKASSKRKSKKEKKKEKRDKRRRLSNGSEQQEKPPEKKEPEVDLGTLCSQCTCELCGAKSTEARRQILNQFHSIIDFITLSLAVANVPVTGYKVARIFVKEGGEQVRVASGDRCLPCSLAVSLSFVDGWQETLRKCKTNPEFQRVVAGVRNYLKAREAATIKNFNEQEVQTVRLYGSRVECEYDFVTLETFKASFGMDACDIIPESVVQSVDERGKAVKGVAMALPPAEGRLGNRKLILFTEDLTVKKDRLTHPTPVTPITRHQTRSARFLCRLCRLPSSQIPEQLGS